MDENQKTIHRYKDSGIEIIIEMPITNNSEKNKVIINDIKSIMNKELSLQLNK